MIVTEIGEQLTSLSLALMRMIGLFSMLPFLGRSVLPGGVRTAVAASASLVVVPAVAPDGLPVLNELDLVVLALKEWVIGMLLGFVAATIYYAVEASGFFIDNQRGSTMASSVDPLTGSQSSPLGIFLTQFLSAYIMLSGGFLLLLATIYQSYVLLPVLSFYPSLDLDGTLHFLAVLDRVVTLAVVIASPAMIAMFLSEFGLGLVSRFAPQLNVFFLAMPVKSAVGIFMLILYINILPDVFDRELARLTAEPGFLEALLR